MEKHKSISVYTATTNAIENEYCVIEGIKSALLFADEVIVVDSYSTDGTVDKIKKIGDPRVKIFYNEWLENIGRGMYASQKNMSLGRCTSDWCILMDSDEVFHENDADKIKRIANEATDGIYAVYFNTLHFYGGYEHLMNKCGVWKDLYEGKIYMVRNGMSIHHGAIGSDPDGHVLNDCSPIQRSNTIMSDVTMYHYGHARSKECYMKKQNTIDRRYNPLGSNCFVSIPPLLFPFVPNDRLTKFTGAHPNIMSDRISVGLDHKKIVGLYEN